MRGGGGCNCSDDCACKLCDIHNPGAADETRRKVELMLRGCAMAWGGDCTCGDDCACLDCPVHPGRGLTVSSSSSSSSSSALSSSLSSLSTGKGVLAMGFAAKKGPFAEKGLDGLPADLDGVLSLEVDG